MDRHVSGQNERLPSQEKDDLLTPFKAAICAALTLICAAAVAPCWAASYSFDSMRSNVNFTYYVGFVSQSGRFTKIEGLVDFDGRAPGRGAIDAVIQTASLTANAWQTELRGSRFFNVTVFPEIRFKSRSVKSTGESRADFSGDLTMNGVTQPVTLHVSFEQARGGHSGSAPAITATAHIKRSDFNMTSLRFLVDDGIDIEIKAALQERKTVSHAAK